MNKTFEKRDIKKKSENLSDWYSDVVLKAQLADYSPVPGAMVIRPYGYAIWEHVQKIMDGFMKTAGLENAYFPLFIPHSLLEKEKEHVKGFAPELAIVTIGGGEKLKDPLVVRPTSETIMYAMYKKWIQSWRDLPVLINQWNNVIRWEKRTYLFLRTMEFLWHEAHTAHETEKEAIKMCLTAQEWYRIVYEDYFAIPAYIGTKSMSEKFAGAKDTYTIELLMPDGKVLQGATSHNLAQNFSIPFEITFSNREGKLDHVWQTSYAITTRSIGALVLVHGDNNGLILPPKIAPIQVVIMPIFNKDADRASHIAYCTEIKEALDNAGIRSKLDTRDEPSVGRRFNEWELKGVPVRFEIGGQEFADHSITIARRDSGEKEIVSRKEMLVHIEKVLASMQESLLAKARKNLEEHTHSVSTFAEFEEIMKTSRGFIRALWCEEASCEAAIKEKTKANTRCLPLGTVVEEGICVHCGKPATHRWLFGQSY